MEIEAKESATPLPDAAESTNGSRKGRLRMYLSISAGVAFFLFPILFLVFGHRRTHVDAAPQAANGLSIPVLEAAVRANPTAANQLELSRAYINAKRPGMATPVLEAMLQADPENADAWNNLCVAQTLLMNYEKGVSDCRRALALRPDYQLAKNNLNWAQDELQKAQNSIAQKEQLPPTNHTASVHLAEGLDFLHIGNYDQAIRSWKRVLELDPGNALAANNMGVAYMDKNQPSEAVPWFRKAMQLDPSMQLARNNLAWAQDELNKKQAVNH